MRKSKSILMIILAALFIMVFGMSAYVTAAASKNIAGTDGGNGIDQAAVDECKDVGPQCILVLGCAVWENNEPSPMLKDRLDTAIELYRKGAAPKLLLSGDNSVKEYSEPDCMLAYTLKQGVPAEDIFLDFAGFSTYDSIYRAKAVFRADRLVVVTQRYHLFRALNICDALGITAKGVASDQRKYRKRFFREVREVLARDKDMIKGKMKPEPALLGGEIPVDGDGRITHVNSAYTLESSHEVDGRQGIAWEDGRYYVSGSTTLSVYDSDWNRIKTETEPFTGFDAEVNHIGDIDVYNGEIYAGVEYFMDGVGSNIQMAVYDADTLNLKRTYMFEPDSGQMEVSGIAVDPDHSSMWMCSWIEDESSTYLYRYDLESGEYLGRVHMKEPPQWIQGIAYNDGWMYITSDDGSADDDEPDHVYKCFVDTGLDEFSVLPEKTLDDVTRQGEIEGISFDKDRKQMLISYNRGAVIVKGMPSGFYEGYDKEVHEIFVYDILKGVTSLGVDTICEGVETEEQARFLQEIGCSKLQGYFFLKPVPIDQLLEQYDTAVTKYGVDAADVGAIQDKNIGTYLTAECIIVKKNIKEKRRCSHENHGLLSYLLYRRPGKGSPPLYRRTRFRNQAQASDRISGLCGP